ncbi:MAG: tyrosine-type recombinase/integrase [Ruminococcus sp.]|jgi:integrase
MAEKRKDNRGRNLRTGEYYDDKNQRYIFRKMIDGERVSITAQNLAELRQQENELLCRIDKGGSIKNRNPRMMLNEYFDFWMETFAKSGRKATTCTNYKSYYNAHVKNGIGKKPIAKITKVDCQKIINSLADSGKAHSTLTNLKSCLNVIFECALDDEIILKNPIKNIKLPQTGSKKRGAIKEQHIRIFMNYVKNNPQYAYTYPAFVVLFNMGMRIGEMAALTWADVDFKKNLISVDKTVNRYRKADYGFTMAIASPKSETSDRVIPMNNVVKAALLAMRMRNSASDACLPYVDDAGRIQGHVSGFVFLNSIGNVWSEPSFLSMIKRITKQLNKEAAEQGTEQIEDFCPHMARHTYTSLAYSAGADVKAVSEILGHASTSVTLDTYTHLTEEKKKQQEAVMQKVKIS